MSVTSHMHSPADVNRQVPHVAAVRATGKRTGKAKPCVACNLNIQTVNASSLDSVFI